MKSVEEIEALVGRLEELSLAYSGTPYQLMEEAAKAIRQLLGYKVEYETIMRTLATPPTGWFTTGTHVGQDVELEFWGYHGDTPIWERPTNGH